MNPTLPSEVEETGREICLRCKQPMPKKAMRCSYCGVTRTNTRLIVMIIGSILVLAMAIGLWVILQTPVPTETVETEVDEAAQQQQQDNRPPQPPPKPALGN